ncbi:hypothetical protein, partial [Paraburkholderia sp. J63]|uniref:hypothetical protein n=1 Tax=Paraburkholderia sp. J63 TaxID=2805434 RepID=UPI0039F5EAFA
ESTGAPTPGNAEQFALQGTYALSKGTRLYSFVVHASHASLGFSNVVNGTLAPASQTSVGLGIVHLF